MLFPLWWKSHSISCIYTHLKHVQLFNLHVRWTYLMNAKKNVLHETFQYADSLPPHIPNVPEYTKRIRCG